MTAPAMNADYERQLCARAQELDDTSELAETAVVAAAVVLVWRTVRGAWAWWAVRAWSHRLRTRPWDGEVCRWCAAPLDRQSAMCPARCTGWESWIRDGLADIYRRAAERDDPDVPL